ncbi:MAG: SBBP repeat-containing protein, partial [Acidimicrobiales bacterium]|nr:SBBP repeat-containing protein [Acidimicrobiales bacterium]
MKQFLNSLSNRNKCVSALRLRLSFLFVTAVLAGSAIVGLSGSTAGAWSSEDGAVAVWAGLAANDGLYGTFNNPDGYESLAVDAAGSMYFTGHFRYSVDFNASPTGATIMTADSTAGCTHQSFVMKLDLFAEPYWARQFGNDVSNTSCAVLPRSIAVDGNGNVYTTGIFQGGSGDNTVDFDPGAGVANLVNIGSATNVAFVSKLNSSGEFVWAYRIGSENVPGTSCDGCLLGEAKTYSVAADGSGNVYVVGTFWGSTSFQHGAGVTTLNSSRSEQAKPDTFILKLNSSGEQVWLRQIEAPTGYQTSSPTSVAVDVSGNVYTAGTSIGGATIDFDPSGGVANLTISDAGQQHGFDAWILKLDSAGDYVWAKASQCDGTSEINSGVAVYGNDRSLAVDGSGNVYLVGTFTQRHYNDNDDCDFDPGPGEEFPIVGMNPQSSGFVWKLDSAGNYQWVKVFLNTDEFETSNRIDVSSV